MAVACRKFAQDIREVKIDGAVDNAEPACNLRAGEPVRRELQAVLFTAAERRALRCRSEPPLDHALDEELVEVLTEQHDLAEHPRKLIAPFPRDDRFARIERDDVTRRIGRVNRKGYAARDAMRRGIGHERVRLRVPVSLAILVPQQRQRIFERGNHPRIAVDVGALVVTDHPFAWERGEHVHALVVVGRRW
jgi:hypothetical protein